MFNNLIPLLGLATLVALAGLILIRPLRRSIITRPIFSTYRKVLPQMSDTERDALEDRDNNGALHRRAHHDDEVLNQRVAQFGPQWRCRLHLLRKILAIAQQEIDEVKHDAECREETQCSLPNDKRPR